MKDIVSVIVVIVFLVIVFRKRIAPLLKVFRKPKKEETLLDEIEMKRQAFPKLKYGFVYCEVLTFNIINLDENFDETDLAMHVTGKLTDKLDILNLRGEVEKIDYRCNESVLFVFIRWRMFRKSRVCDE